MTRLLTALVAAFAGLAAAAYLHSYRELSTLDLRGLTSYGSAFVPPPEAKVARRPGWDDPAAALAAVLGVGGAAIVLRRRRADA